jgi:hypothetical protein
MGYRDIERAREGQAAFRRIFDAYVGSRASVGALRRVVDVCTAPTPAAFAPAGAFRR